MLATMIPLFDGNTAVKAYSLFVQKENYLLNPSMLGSGRLDGAGHILGLEVVNNLGIETLAEDQMLLIEISNISIFSDIEAMCEVPHDRIILLAGKDIPAKKEYLDRFEYLKSKGYKIAMKGLMVTQFEEYAPILGILDYIMLDYKKINMSGARAFFGKYYPNIELIAVNVASLQDFEMLAESGAYTYFEGDFYRLPITQGEKDVSPLKANFIELLNIVNDSDFELTKAADVISRDTAMVIELLRVVNRMSRNSEITSIRHAAAMLGQRELKKWINTVVTGRLCADKPNEITRTSLLRAKFAENLATTYEMASLSSELFLMGLFSILDIILDKPMDEALKIVNVSKNIRDALIDHKGDMAKVYDFVTAYEAGNWTEVSRQMVLSDIKESDVYNAYIDSLKWYRDLFGKNAK